MVVKRFWALWAALGIFVVTDVCAGQPCHTSVYTP
jgi:hypothetical protein